MIYTLYRYTVTHKTMITVICLLLQSCRITHPFTISPTKSTLSVSYPLLVLPDPLPTNPSAHECTANLDGGVLTACDHLVLLLVAPVNAVDLAQVGGNETHSRGWLLWKPPPMRDNVNVTLHAHRYGARHEHTSQSSGYQRL